MADEVKSSGVARVLEPMSSADRKIIHDTLSGASTDCHALGRRRPVPPGRHRSGE
jgi:predicted RNA-binding protein Jag